jgi:hypothetical protein
MAGQGKPETQFPSRPLDLVERAELDAWDERIRRIRRAPRGEYERRLKSLRADVHRRIAEQLPPAGGAAARKAA